MVSSISGVWVLALAVKPGGSENAAISDFTMNSGTITENHVTLEGGGGIAANGLGSIGTPGKQTVSIKTLKAWDMKHALR